MWPEGNTSRMITISGNLSSPMSLFVTLNGDIYVDNGNTGRIDMWPLNATSSVPVLNVTKPCYGLFIDISNNIYCSLNELSQVVKKSLLINANASTIVAGTGAMGALSTMLAHPRGIFVDISLNLYVADLREQ